MVSMSVLFFSYVRTKSTVICNLVKANTSTQIILVITDDTTTYRSKNGKGADRGQKVKIFNCISCGLAHEIVACL